MSSNSEKTTLQRLMELKDLYESGLITKEEMEAKKRQILETDDSPVDNPNGEIENESNVDIPNQADLASYAGTFLGFGELGENSTTQLNNSITILKNK